MKLIVCVFLIVVIIDEYNCAPCLLLERLFNLDLSRSSHTSYNVHNTYGPNRPFDTQQYPYVPGYGTWNGYGPVYGSPYGPTYGSPYGPSYGPSDGPSDGQMPYNTNTTPRDQRKAMRNLKNNL